MKLGPDVVNPMVYRQISLSMFSVKLYD